MGIVIIIVVFMACVTTHECIKICRHGENDNYHEIRRLKSEIENLKKDVKRLINESYD